MAELAVNGVHYNDDGTLNKVNYSDMWDSHMIRGCHCLKPEGVYHTSGFVHARNRHLPRGGSRMADAVDGDEIDATKCGDDTTCRAMAASPSVWKSTSASGARGRPGSVER